MGIGRVGLKLIEIWSCRALKLEVAGIWKYLTYPRAMLCFAGLKLYLLSSPNRKVQNRVSCIPLKLNLMLTHYEWGSHPVGNDDCYLAGRRGHKRASLEGFGFTWEGL